MPISDDSRAILLLGSHLGLGERDALQPLSLREWNSLERKIRDSAFRTPGRLLQCDPADLRKELALDSADAERLARLLQRGGMLAIERERLETLGIWTITRNEEHYPARLKERLDASAPLVLFGAGPLDLVGSPGLAVIGSRDADEPGLAAAAFAGRACARIGWTVYSGAARGIGASAMQAGLDCGGKVVGLLADSLEKAIRIQQNRRALSEGTLALLTLYSPRAPFSVGAAMARNKLIYVLADYALVVSCQADSGGTWAGARDALKASLPVFVRIGPDVPDGNRKLLDLGAILFPDPFPDPLETLPAWLARHAVKREIPSLFD